MKLAVQGVILFSFWLVWRRHSNGTVQFRWVFKWFLHQWMALNINCNAILTLSIGHWLLDRWCSPLAHLVLMRTTPRPPQERYSQLPSWAVARRLCSRALHAQYCTAFDQINRWNPGQMLASCRWTKAPQRWTPQVHPMLTGKTPKC